MKMELKKKIVRWAGTYPRRECPHCGYGKLERASRYCSMCGKPLKTGKGTGSGNKKSAQQRGCNPPGRKKTNQLQYTGIQEKLQQL